MSVGAATMSITGIRSVVVVVVVVTGGGDDNLRRKDGNKLLKCEKAGMN